MDTVPIPITIDSLLRVLGTRAAPLVIDVRREPAYRADTATLPAALRREPEAVGEWGALLPAGRQLVVVCVHGHEVSQGVATTLRRKGLDARFLQDGIEGWKLAGGAVMRRTPAFGTPSASPTRWVTRERPKIDRIACPWLIRRFIDPLAEFLYVPAGDVQATAESTGGIAFDTPGAPVSHRGDRCSFDALLDDYGLNHIPLGRLAAIVRGADTGKPEISPESAGLLAVSLGLSANFPRDHEMLEQGMVIYDAIYAWLSSASAQTHNAKLFE